LGALLFGRRKLILGLDRLAQKLNPLRCKLLVDAQLLGLDFSLLCDAADNCGGLSVDRSDETSRCRIDLRGCLLCRLGWAGCGSGCLCESLTYVGFDPLRNGLQLRHCKVETGGVRFKLDDTYANDISHSFASLSVLLWAADRYEISMTLKFANTSGRSFFLIDNAL
jgi:hypothetical protein